MPSPYNISFNPKTEVYNFTTDQGLIYNCKFDRITSYLSPLLDVQNIEVYEFSFYLYDPHPEERKGYDQRIEPTLINLLTGYFTSPNCIITYVCEMSDGRAIKRAKLFERWGNHMNNVLTHYTLTISVPSETIYGGLFARKDFPNLEILQKELIEKIPGIILNKYEP